MTDTSTQMKKDRDSLPERVELARRHPPQQAIKPPFDTAVILVFLPHNSCTPFVTWQEGKDGATYWGHYHHEISAAVEDYESR